MTVEELLCRMYPGDKKRGLASYSELGLTVPSELQDEEVRKLNDGLAKIDEEVCLHDVNLVVRTMKKVCPTEMNALINASIFEYFCCEQIVRVLRQGEAKIFPNSRTLPDIDFDLLEPVIELEAER